MGPQAANGARAVARSSITSLASELGGDLPCVRCGYNLKGLSIRSVCPECGTPMGATLLAVVDPLASELRPIPHPRRTAAGVMTWSIAALLATLGVWTMRLVEVVPQDSRTQRAEFGLGTLVVLMTMLSGIGATALIKPHEGIKAQDRRMATLAVAAYVPLVLVMVWLCFEMGGFGAGLWGEGLSLVPAKLRVLADGLMIVIIVGLRPNARLLAARSVLMRQGRVDRQTMMALAGVLGVMMAGDAAALVASVVVGPVADSVREIGQMVVLVGGLLFTLGLVGVVLDCWRMRPVIAEAPLSLTKLFGKPA
jgi:hypothetical protein